MQSLGGLLSSLERETFRPGEGVSGNGFFFSVYDGSESAHGQIAITKPDRQRHDAPYEMMIKLAIVRITC